MARKSEKGKKQSVTSRRSAIPFCCGCRPPQALAILQLLPRRYLCTVDSHHAQDSYQGHGFTAVPQLAPLTIPPSGAAFFIHRYFPHYVTSNLSFYSPARIICMT